MSRRSRIITAVVAATVATSIGGSIAADPDSAWYRTRKKPPFNPPNAVFPIVWTSLYTDIAATCGTTLADLAENDDDRARPYAIALGVNLALNGGWSAAFFRAHNLSLATLWAGALALSSADLVRRTAQHSTARGLALAPYAAWCSFATVLSGAIWQRNR